MLIRTKDMKDKAIECNKPDMYLWFEEGNCSINGNWKPLIKENLENWKSKTIILKLSNVSEVIPTVAYSWTILLVSNSATFTTQPCR
jgi:hypothetical protein